MANLRTMTIHSCCLELRYSWLPLLYEAGHCPAETSHTVLINNIEHNYVVAKYRLYDVEQLNFLGQSFALFCGCRKLLPTVNFLYIGRSETLISTPVPGFVHHTFAEENVIRRRTKFGIGFSMSSPSIYDTNEHVHVSVRWSKLVQNMVSLAELCIDEAFDALSGRTFSSSSDCSSDCWITLMKQTGIPILT
jgi:hypothetical protein